MAKLRKRKPANGRVSEKEKEIKAIVNLAYQGVILLGDCFYAPRAMNIQKLWTHLRGICHDIGMNEFIKVLNKKKDWVLGLMCVFKNNEGKDEYEVANATAIIRDIEGQDVGACLSEVILKTIQAIQESDETLTNDRFVYYGFFLEPEVSLVLDKKLNGLMHLFMNISDITMHHPFNDTLPGVQSDDDTLLNAIKNNCVFPKVKEIKYIPIDDSNLEGDLNAVQTLL